MRKNAPIAWERVHSGAAKVRGAWDEHSDEITAAMEVVAQKSAQGLRVVIEYDDEIVAAVAVLGIFQPQLLVVAGSYEVIKPGILALTKVMNARQQGHEAERLNEQDWKEVVRLAKWWKTRGMAGSGVPEGAV